MCALPRKVILSGSDCFHLVLDKHAHNYRTGSNVMRIVFRTREKPDVEKLNAQLNSSPLIQWLCNIRLHSGGLFGRPYWEYTGGNQHIPFLEHQFEQPGILPAAILQRDLPLQQQHFIECDLVHYPDHTSAIVISWNHILLDGRGIGMLVQHLNELYEGQPARPMDVLFPPPEKKASWPSYIRNMYRVKSFIEKSSRAPVASVASGYGKEPSQFHTQLIQFSTEETALIQQQAVKAGARFGPNLFYLSSCAQAVRARLDEKNIQGPLWIPIPYDGRLRGAFGPVITNTVAFLFYRLERDQLQHLPGTVSALQQQMTDQMRDKMPQRYSMLLNMMRHIPLNLYYFLVNRRGKGAFASFLYSSTGDSFNQLDRFMGMPVEHVTIYPSPTFPPGLTFSFLKHRDALNINIAYSPDIIPQANLQRLTVRLRQMLLGSGFE
jgi:hypothetical protein